MGSRSSGYCPPRCYQASSALSRQLLTVDLSPPVPSPLRDRRSRFGFLRRPAGQGVAGQGASRGKTHGLPVCRPASVRFGCCPSDIGTRSSTSARPPPRTHIAGSLFATYTGSAIRLPSDGHCWYRPCRVLAFPFRPTRRVSGIHDTPPCFSPCAMPGTRQCESHTSTQRNHIS